MSPMRIIADRPTVIKSGLKQEIKSLEAVFGPENRV